MITFSDPSFRYLPCQSKMPRNKQKNAKRYLKHHFNENRGKFAKTSVGLNFGAGDENAVDNSATFMNPNNWSRHAGTEGSSQHELETNISRDSAIDATDPSRVLTVHPSDASDDEKPASASTSRSKTTEKSPSAAAEITKLKSKLLEANEKCESLSKRAAADSVEVDRMHRKYHDLKEKYEDLKKHVRGNPCMRVDDHWVIKGMSFTCKFEAES